MRIKRSYLFAGAVLAIPLSYFAISAVVGGHGKKAEAAPAKKGVDIQAVQVRDVAQVLRPYEVEIRGRTEAPRTVEVKSETAGVVGETPTPQGTFVKAGQVLCRLQVDARQATLDQARAQLKSMQLQYGAAQQLQAKGFRSETQVLAAKASMDQAAAAVRSAEVALNQVNIRAPFAGVFDKRSAEVGTYLAAGGACGTVIELDPLLVVGDVPEDQAARLSAGAPATATLTTGGEVHGKVRFVARQADPATRTYRVEVIAQNPGAKVRAGLSGSIHIAAGEGPAHLVPTSALVLDTSGRQGVRYVIDGNKVAFAPVKTLQETPEGVWIQGLTGPAKVITVGQAYVSEGQTVRVSAAR